MSSERLLTYKEEAIRATLCTDRADRPRAEKAIAEIYRASGYKRPVFNWFESPLAGAVYTLEQWAKCNLLEAYCGRCRFYNLEFEASVKLSTVDTIPASVGRSLISVIQHAVHIRGDESPAVVYGYEYGQHDACRIAATLFSCEDAGREPTPALAAFGELARSCGWWKPFGDNAVCCERPTTQRVNDRNVPHCEDGPAVAFGDGFRAWALDGRLVDRELVMEPERQSTHRIRNESNAELKRIMIERYAGKDRPPAEGWARYLSDICAHCVDRRGNAVEEALFRTDDGETVLVCSCPSTARVYALEVPQSCSTVEQAQTYLHSESQLDETPPNVIGRS